MIEKKIIKFKNKICKYINRRISSNELCRDMFAENNNWKLYGKFDNRVKALLDLRHDIESVVLNFEKRMKEAGNENP
jgi:hypothetical protein